MPSRLKNALNRLEGVLCRMQLRKKTAQVSCNRHIAEIILKENAENGDIL